MTVGTLPTIAVVAGAVLLINIPFGFWRDSTRRFSLAWILAIHVPVPIVIALRLVSHLGWQFSTFPVLIGSFFLGQFIGGRLHRWWVKRQP
ncbi:MAG: hypothetical protein WCI95_11580 [bacterium]